VDRPVSLNHSYGVIPLSEAGLLSQVDFLPFPNQTDHQCPPVHEGAEAQEILWLRSAMATFSLDPLRIPGPLGLIVNPDVLLGLAASVATIRLQEAMYVLHKYTALERVLEDFNERAITGQEHSCTLVSLEMVGINKLQANECFSGARYSCYEHQMEFSSRLRLVSNPN
jgi:hypothetical protein